jgi:hypothetical protein
MTTTPAATHLPLETELALMRLVNRFAALVDHEGGIGVEELFTESGGYGHDGTWSHGRAAIRSAYDARREAGPRTARHLMTNALFEVLPAAGDDPAGSDVVHGRSIMLIHAADGTPPFDQLSPMLVADVADEYHRVSGEWQIARRELRTVFRDATRPSRLPLGAPATSGPTPRPGE